MTSKLHYIPIGIVVLFGILVCLTYAIAVGLDHINAFFSYISDTGTLPPEMCIFGLGLAVEAVLLYLFVHINFKQLEEFIKRNFHEEAQFKSASRLNKAAFILGCLTSFGSVVVGTFQEASLLLVHIIGACLVFGFGSVYLIVIGVLSLRMVPQIVSRRIALFRIVAGSICLFLFVICEITGFLAFYDFTSKDEHHVVIQSLKWEEHHGGWAFRIISTVSEWIMVALFLVIILTYVKEFKNLTYHPPKFELDSAQTLHSVLRPPKQSISVANEKKSTLDVSANRNKRISRVSISSTINIRGENTDLKRSLPKDNDKPAEVNRKPSSTAHNKKPTEQKPPEARRGTMDDSFRA